MTDSNTHIQDKKKVALAYAWGQYQVYAHTSRKKKKILVTWRFVVVVLGITGAFLGVLCQDTARLLEICQLDQTSECCSFSMAIWSWMPEFLTGSSHFVPRLLGILSALVLGLATYFGKELLNPEQEREWIRARSCSEALKAEVYKFLTHTDPYTDKDNATLLLEETEKILESVKDIAYIALSEQKKQKRIPSNLSTVTAYINLRVNDQIDGYYRPKSEEYTRKMKFIKNIGLLIGIVVVFLGALGTTGWTGGWVAFFTTVTASIAAYAYSGRYQYLIISYQATANRLELLQTQWQTSGFTDDDLVQRNRFILNCEEAISIENSAWMAKLVQKGQPADLAKK